MKNIFNVEMFIKNIETVKCLLKNCNNTGSFYSNDKFFINELLLIIKEVLANKYPDIKYIEITYDKNKHNYKFRLNKNHLDMLREIINTKNCYLAKEYLVKSIRADELNYFRVFSEMITPSACFNKKIPLRLNKKEYFVVDGNDIYERNTKPSKYSIEQKKGFSQSNSTTLVTKEVIPPLFGFNRDRRNKLIGIRIGLKDALLTDRLFIYDGGTINRPYHHSTRKDAEQYYNNKVTSRNPVLYADINDFKNAITKQHHQGKYNEILARIRWNNDGSSQIIIGSDTLEARLLAQDYARIILKRLKEQAKENNSILNSQYEIPICFYNVESRNNLEIYNLFEQACDRRIAENIYLSEVQRYQKYEANDYEFLLFLKDSQKVLHEIYNGQSLFQKILNDGYIHIAQTLIENTLDNDILTKLAIKQSHFKPSAVYYTTLSGNNSLLFWLIKSGAPIESSQYPSLVAACIKGNDEAVKRLLLAGIDVNYVDQRSGRTAIQIAADTERWNIVKSLLINGAKLNHQHKNIYNQLLLNATEQNVDEEIIHHLLRLSNAFNLKTIHNGYTAFHWLVVNKKTMLVKELIEKSINIDDKTTNNKTALQLAFENRIYDIVSLLANVANLNFNDSDMNGFILVIAAKNNNFDTLRNILKYKISINIHFGEYAYTALHWAVHHNNYKMCELLLKYNASILVRSSSGYTPLRLACCLKYWDIAHLFIENVKITPKLKNHYSKILLSAVVNKQYSLAKALIVAGASISKYQSKHNGYTALHWAIHNNDEVMIRLLQDNGASFDLLQYNSKRINNILTNECIHKFEILQSLKVELFKAKWDARNSSFLFGLSLFGKCAPDIILRLRTLIINLPDSHDIGLLAWAKVEKIFIDCLHVLETTQASISEDNLDKDDLAQFCQNQYLQLFNFNKVNSFSSVDRLQHVDDLASFQMI